MDTCTAPTPEEFNTHYGHTSQPVLIRGVASAWKAMERWNLPEFLRTVPRREVKVSRTDESEPVKMDLHEFFHYISGSEDNPYYLRDWRFDKDCPAMLNDYEVPVYFESWSRHLPESIRPVLRWLYVGPDNSGTGLHLDTMDTSAWNAVITGRKHWLFFPREDGPRLYNGHADMFRPDFDRFPLIKGLAPVYCVQEPGEIVFTPSTWWHQVYNEKGGISITENFVNETNYRQVEDFFIANRETEKLGLFRRLREEVMGAPANNE